MRNERLIRVPWRDAGIIAAALVLFLLGAMIQSDGDAYAAPPAAAYPLAAATCAVLPLRNRAPRTAVAVTTAGASLVEVLGMTISPLSLAPLIVAAYALGVRTERPGGNATMAVSCAVVAVTAVVSDYDVWWEEILPAAAMVCFPLLADTFGRSVRNRRAYLAAMAERARRAEQTRESEARRRVVEERMRIARELHDVVAHHITLAHAQAAVATRFFDAEPERARASLGRLSDTTRDALDELRATVGLLRNSEDQEAPYEPTPGLARLPSLVASFREAGLRVAVHEEGQARPLSPGVDLTAYRIVQEALTNVSKHAGSGTARVTLAYDRDRLRISVADDGRSPAASPSPGKPPGHGLIGMRERVAAVGGRLTTGHRPEGGYLVTTELPLPLSDTKRPAVDGHRSDGDGNNDGNSQGTEGSR